MVAPISMEEDDGGNEGGDGGNDGGEGDAPLGPVAVSHFYVVIKVTQNNRELGDKQVWQGMHVYCGDGGYSFQFFTPSIPDHMLSNEDEGGDIPEFDFGSGYTSAQLAQMRAEQEEKIQQLELDVRIAEADYKLMKLEVSDGNIYAKFDGTVISVLTEEEAKSTQQPVLKVSGGGGFYIEATVSELERDSIVVGTEVTVNDWRTGMTCTGVIHSVGDFPSNQNGFNGMGNPNASYYPLIVFVDGSADLQEGSYVSVRYSSGGQTHGIYLEKPFLRTEQGESFVYVRGADGKLEKRIVTTGKSLWGNYMEILEGLTEEDLIAFPYGKGVKPGAPTREGDLGDLYG